jgi:hypothetical protein
MKTSLTFILSAAVISGCSSSVDLMSRWRAGDLPATEQRGVYVKDQNIVVDVMNDDDYLYLTVGVSDRMKQRQIVFQGLTVWFDYQGGDDKRFGVRYPLRTDRPGYGEERPDRGQLRDSSWTFPENFPDELDLLGPAEGEHHRLGMSETKGIEARVQNNSGTLVYTLKVPLMDTGGHLYAIGAHAGTTIGLGIETGGSLQGQGGGRPRGEGGGGEGRGRMGGRGGFGGRGRGGEGGGGDQYRSAREPMKFWAKVQLAAPGAGH